MTAMLHAVDHVHATDCGVRLALMDTYVIPLTDCCASPATNVGTCSGCWQHAREAMGLCAIVGHPQFEPDLRKILVGLGCETPPKCVSEVADLFVAQALTHTHETR